MEKTTESHHLTQVIMKMSKVMACNADSTTNTTTTTTTTNPLQSIAFISFTYYDLTALYPRRWRHLRREERMLEDLMNEVSYDSGDESHSKEGLGTKQEPELELDEFVQVSRRWTESSGHDKWIIFKSEKTESDNQLKGKRRANILTKIKCAEWEKFLYCSTTKIPLSVFIYPYQLHTPFIPCCLWNIFPKPHTLQQQEKIYTTKLSMMEEFWRRKASQIVQLDWYNREGHLHLHPDKTKLRHDNQWKRA